MTARVLGLGSLVLAACGTPTRAAPDAASGSDAGTIGRACDPVSATACQGDAIVACNPDGTLGGVVMACGDGRTCSGGTCVDACTADGVDLIYVVTKDQGLLSFDPRKLPGDPFTLVGQLTCPVTLPSLLPGVTAVEPFSMAIDRGGTAWVEYTSGEVFTVALSTATCAASPYVPQAAGMSLFGMGFSTDAAAALSEQLFLAGGSRNAAPGGQLAHVDTHGAQYRPVIVGPIFELSDVNAELTGTSEGKLYGFFPRVFTPSYVQELDKVTVAPIGGALNISANGLGSDVSAWAFAQWGGRFYVFVTSNANSTVRVIDRTTGTPSIALEMLPYMIVGAGVSTCAPVQ